MKDHIYSIIVPVYNVEDFVEDCIESVLRQSYQNYELILIDDGSPDHSGMICDKYCQISERVTVHHIQNNGALHARIFGIEHSHGDYIIFLDSDDLLHENALEIIDQTIKDNNCDCVIYGMELFRDKIILETCTVSEEVVISNKRDLYKKCLMSSWYNSLCRKAVKASIFQGVDYSEYYHISHGEDLLLSLEILKNSKKVCFIPNLLYRYRMNPGSATHTLSVANYRIDFSVRQKVMDFLFEENVFSPNDMAEYRAYCASLICDNIQMINSFKTDRKTKKKMFSEIYYSDYYQKEILGQSFSINGLPKWKLMVFFAFQKEQYNRVLLLLGLKNQIARIKRV